MCVCTFEVACVPLFAGCCASTWLITTCLDLRGMSRVPLICRMLHLGLRAASCNKVAAVAAGGGRGVWHVLPALVFCPSIYAPDYSISVGCWSCASPLIALMSITVSGTWCGAFHVGWQTMSGG
jgi:hypothetical protein